MASLGDWAKPMFKRSNREMNRRITFSIKAARPFVKSRLPSEGSGPLFSRLSRANRQNRAT